MPCNASIRPASRTRPLLPCELADAQQRRLMEWLASMMVLMLVLDACSRVQFPLTLSQGTAFQNMWERCHSNYIECNIPSFVCSTQSLLFPSPSSQQNASLHAMLGGIIEQTRSLYMYVYVCVPCCNVYTKCYQRYAEQILQRPKHKKRGKKWRAGSRGCYLRPCFVVSYLLWGSE